MPAQNGQSTSQDGARAFSRRFIRLAGPYFVSRRGMPGGSSGRWIAAFLLLLTVVQVAIQVRFNVWNRDFFNTLEERRARAFFFQMGVFGLLASASMAVSIYQVYVKQLLQLAWREWLTRRLIGRWLAESRHYLLPFLVQDADNPDQRIAEDGRMATELAVEFAVGLFNAVLMLATFVGILWTLSGPLQLALGGIAITIPGYMVWAALLYAMAGSALALGMGRPLIGLNAERTRFEADLRFALARVRENSEPIALVRGERDEARDLSTGLRAVVSAVRDLMRGQRRLMWLTSGYAMVAMVFPTLVASPQYFAGALTLGGLMQIAAAFQQVQIALSWFVDNFPRLAEWRSAAGRVVRLNDALVSLSALEENPTLPRIARSESEGQRIVLADLSIDQADGRTILADASATIEAGERVLITGPEGTPAGMLLRVLAGVWPFGEGSIEAPPASRCLFLPQRPYLRSGTLLAALAYPALPASRSAGEAATALEKVGLAHLVPRLEETERWDRVLGPGEHQRLAVAHALSARPDWLFMDEALSALDDAGQRAMLELLAESLPTAGVISVGRGPVIEAWHTRRLELVLHPDGARLEVPKPPARRGRRISELALE